MRSQKLLSMHSEGDIKQLWAERYDAEMKRFILVPIDHLKCDHFPGSIKETSLHLFRSRAIAIIERAKGKFLARIKGRK